MMCGNEREWLLIAGLGNPGRKYAGNRHNIGFRCLDRLAQTYQLAFDEKRDKAQLARGQIGSRHVVLVKPQTFVNLSGEAVGAVARFFKIEPDNVLVIYDDLDLEQGTIRLRPGGGSGGHNGIKSIIEHLGTQSFPRLRVGIGRPPGQMEPKDYVLQDWGEEERQAMEEVCEWAIAAVETLIRLGVKETMDRFNQRPRVSEAVE
ncbi:MAG: aminoacyl-tRNA hydrolase [Anaerolineae bacterium]|jgi:PTH1 family peptidyl-tRNA hydrolase|nr:aminoacyl-tRNA hydrolase [Anaerolineae bacterium]